MAKVSPSYFTLFQSTPSLRRATRRTAGILSVGLVSIHALLAESDAVYLIAPSRRSSFNPRPPCGERPKLFQWATASSRFQSTPSLRRATSRDHVIRDRFQCFNPRPPCGERRNYPSRCHLASRFQSTPSLRRATVPATPMLKVMSRFNPRPPCGERPTAFISYLPNALFQSTPSLRRATAGKSIPILTDEFQSTPSLRRATASTVHVVNQSCKRGFAPTSRRRYITYRLLFIILGCQSAFSNVLQESPTSRQFDVSLGLAQRPCQTALK